MSKTNIIIATGLLLTVYLSACSSIEPDCPPNYIAGTGNNVGEGEDDDAGTATSGTSVQPAAVHEWSFTNTNDDDIAEDALWLWAMETDYNAESAFVFVEATETDGRTGRIAVCAPATALASYAEEAPKRAGAVEHLFESGAWLRSQDMWTEYMAPGDISFVTASTDTFGDYVWTMSYPNARAVDTKSSISLYPGNEDHTRESTVASERFVVRVSESRESACGF